VSELKWFLIGWFSGAFALAGLMFLDLRRRFKAKSAPTDAGGTHA
jgi:hypothetical protein